MSEPDPHSSKEYQDFIASVIPYCRCEYDSPCEGVLAGGMCDEKKSPRDCDSEDDDPYDKDEQKWAADL